MSKTINPFNPGAGTPPPYLAGRKDEMEKFSNLLKNVEGGNSQNMMIYGHRGVGKTVLLHKMATSCIDGGFLPIVNRTYDRTYSDPKVFMKSLRYDVDKAIKTSSKRDKLNHQVGELEKYARAKEIKIPEIISDQPEYGSDDDLLVDQMRDYLESAYESLNAGFKGIIFMLDEFHVIRDDEKKGWNALASFLGAINELQNENYRYSLVLCGLPPMITQIGDARSYSERMFENMLEITNLDEDSTRKAILEPLRNSDWTFSEELVSAILRDSNGYPYFIQFLSNEIIDRTDKSHIGIDDYQRVRDGIIEKLDSSFFDQRMASLTAGQNSILRAMASIPKEEVEITSIYAKTHIKKDMISNHLERLGEKGVIYRPDHGVYRFSMPLFRRYIIDRYLSDNA